MTDQERAERLESEDETPWDEDFKAALMYEFAEVRRATVEQTWADAIAFVEGGSFLHDDAPAARMARECAKAMRDRGPPQRALAPTSKEPT